MRLFITGAPGSGKTRAARAISNELCLAVYYLDDFVWDNSQGAKNRRLPVVVRDEAVLRISSDPSWLVEGTYSRSWLQPILERADCVVILAPPRSLRLLRLIRRHFFERSPFCDPWGNLKLFVSNARWGWGYEQGPLPRLIRMLEATNTAYGLHREGDDVVALAAQIGRARGAGMSQESGGESG